jgi:hypothetical protein
MPTITVIDRSGTARDVQADNGLSLMSMSIRILTARCRK